MERKTHLRELDGLRGVAATGVAIFHLRWIYSQTGNPLADLPYLSWLQDSGWFLVDLFFVISGFVFAHTYLDGGRMKQGVTLRSFGWARIARLWPLHAATLLLAIIVFRDDPNTNLPNILLSGLMLHGLIETKAVLNSPAWSISVECLAYAIFAVAALAGRRALIIASAVALCAGAVMVLSDTAPYFGRGLFGFFVGLFVQRWAQPLAKIPAVPLLLLCSVPFWIDLDAAGILAGTAFGWTAVLLVALRVPALGGQTMRWLGDRSYAIYMVHVPIYHIVGSAVGQLDVSASLAGPIATVAALAMVMLFADMAYRLLERPAQSKLLGWRWPNAGTPVGSAGTKSA